MASTLARQPPAGHGGRRVGRAQKPAGAFLAEHDVLMTPVMASLPPRAAGWREASWLANFMSGARWVPYPGPWNLAGFPAAAVPVARVPSPGPRKGWYLKNYYDAQPALNFGWVRQRDDEPWRDRLDGPGPTRNRQMLRDVLDFWLSRGVAGFRVDMAFSLVKDDRDRDAARAATTEVWREIRRWLDAAHPDAVIVPEGVEPRAGSPLAFHGDFFLVIHTEHLSLFDNHAAGVLPFQAPQTPFFDAEGRGSTRAFLDAWAAAKRVDPVRPVIMSTADHDFDRLACGPRTAEQLGAALTFLLTWGTVPCIYYGDEIGMRYGYPFTYRRGDTHVVVVNPRRDPASVHLPGVVRAHVLLGSGVRISGGDAPGGRVRLRGPCPGPLTLTPAARADRNRSKSSRWRCRVSITRWSFDVGVSVDEKVAKAGRGDDVLPGIDVGLDGDGEPVLHRLELVAVSQERVGVEARQTPQIGHLIAQPFEQRAHAQWVDRHRPSAAIAASSARSSGAARISRSMASLPWPANTSAAAEGRRGSRLMPAG